QYIANYVLVANAPAQNIILKNKYGFELSDLHATKVDQTTTFTAESFISGLFTDNLFKTFTDGNLLQTMVIAILFGIALLQVKNKESRRKVIHMIESLNDMIFSYLNMIIKLTPIGVFFLIADSFGKLGFSIFTS